MVEYVLCNSPTNKESPLSLEPRLRALKFDENDKVRVALRNIFNLKIYWLKNSFFFTQSNDDKEKSNSPFDSNGIKKEDQGNNGNGLIMNGEDDKGVFKWVELSNFYNY